MTVAANDVLQAIWKAQHTDPNTRTIQSFYFQATDVADGDDILVQGELRDRLIALFGQIQGLFSQRYLMNSVRVTNQTQKTLLGENNGAGFVGAGGDVEVLPAQDAALVVARSNALGHQGRKFLGPFTEAAFDNGALTAAAQAACDAFAENWDDSFVGGVTNNTYQPGTASFAQGGALQGFRGFTNGLNTALSDARTQRSRRPGVGLS